MASDDIKHSCRENLNLLYCKLKLSLHGPMVAMFGIA